jgi:hypothetical protein
MPGVVDHGDISVVDAIGEISQDAAEIGYVSRTIQT